MLILRWSFPLKLTLSFEIPSYLTTFKGSVGIVFNRGILMVFRQAAGCISETMRCRMLIDGRIIY